jgi:hypothetical protein
MSSKSLIWIFMTIGSVAGAYAPLLWGDSALSLSSVILSAVGGGLGIWAGYKLDNS